MSISEPILQGDMVESNARVSAPKSPKIASRNRPGRLCLRIQ